MADLTQNDVDNLTTRLFQIENGCKPGLPAPDAQTMLQLLREARVALEQLWERASKSEKDNQSLKDNLLVEQSKEGIWK